jgi:hypothetical protein
MDEVDVNWWMDAERRWHRGGPPAGWWQAKDRRWHPPAEHEPNGETGFRRPASPGHFVGGAHSSVRVRRRG